MAIMIDTVGILSDAFGWVACPRLVGRDGTGDYRTCAYDGTRSYGDTFEDDAAGTYEHVISNRDRCACFVL